MGSTFSRAAVYGLFQRNLLHKFYTTVAVYPKNFFYKLSRVSSKFSQIERRTYHKSLQPYTVMLPFKEIVRLMAIKFGLFALNRHETGVFSVDAVFRNMDLSIARVLKRKPQGIQAVYAYEDGAYYSFKEARIQQIQTIYDLPIGYWKAQRELLNREKELNPEWFETITGFKDSEKKLNRKNKELELADLIIVASTFTGKTLSYYPKKLKTIITIPYAFPEAYTDRTYAPLQGRKMKILFVGGLSQRKGISYLFEAVKGLKDQIELTVVGRKAVPRCEALNEALKNCTWIETLPHDAVLKLMREQDVFVFPSLFEGFGLVVTEAMAQGTPVITTERTCGPDIITDGENGWLVNAGSAQEIRTKLEFILEHPESLERVGTAALHTAFKRPWSVYSDEIGAAVENFLDKDQ